MSNIANIIAANAQKHRKELAMSHQLLPVGDAQNKLCRIAAGNKSSLSILVGPHGSGKTTQMPSIVSKPGPRNAMCRSLVTQPNILSAQAAVEFMTSKASKFAEGKLIGLVDIIRRPKSLSQPRSVITFIPDDILNNWLSTDQGMERLKGYKMIFIDDCHYKSIQTELILLRIKTIMTARNQATNPIHFVLMSATEDIGHLRDFFDVRDEDVLRLSTLFEDPAKPHRREIFTQHDLTSTRLEEMYAKVGAIVSSEETIQDSGILVILPCEADVEAALKHCEGKFPQYACKSLLRLGRKADQMEVITCASPKIVFATDSITLGLTVQNINAAVITGITEITAFDHHLAQSLPSQVLLSEAELQQQACRVGRQYPGKCYYQFTEAKYWKSQQFKTSTITVDDGLEYVLNLISIFPGQLPWKGSMKLITYPQMQIAILAARKLRELKMIESNSTGYQLTKLGKIAISLPALNIHARLFLAAADSKSSSIDLMMKMACILSLPDRRFATMSGIISILDVNKPFEIPKGLHLIMGLGDIWLDLWWFDKCASFGYTKESTIGTVHILDETVFFVLLEIRNQLRTFFDIKRKQENPTTKAIENTVLCRLAEVYQWQLLRVQESGPLELMSSDVSISPSEGEPTIVQFSWITLPKDKVLYLHIVRDDSGYKASHFLVIPSEIYSKMLEGIDKSVATAEDHTKRLRAQTALITEAAEKVYIH